MCDLNAWWCVLPCRPELAYKVVDIGLKAGYRHIDTAHQYGCEYQIGALLGKAFQEGIIAREDVHITTKVGHPPTKVSRFPQSTGSRARIPPANSAERPSATE